LSLLTAGSGGRYNRCIKLVSGAFCAPGFCMTLQPPTSADTSSPRLPWLVDLTQSKTERTRAQIGLQLEAPGSGWEHLSLSAGPASCACSVLLCRQPTTATSYHGGTWRSPYFDIDDALPLWDTTSLDYAERVPEPSIHPVTTHQHNKKQWLAGHKK